MQTWTLPHSRFPFGPACTSRLLEVVLAIWATTASRITSSARQLTVPEQASEEQGRSVPMQSVLVLDASGSMASLDWPPSRIEAAKQAAKAYWRRRAEVAPEARVALVAYSTSAQLLCPPTSVRDGPAFDTAIDGLRPGGTTNMQAGLELASQLLARTRAQGPGEIVLLTDGLNNAQDPRPVAKAIKQFAIVNTVGIGARNEVDESLLRALASEYPDGRKRYRWIGDREGLIGHFRSLGAGIRKA